MAEYETDDLVLATLLIDEGYRARMQADESRETCVWLFPLSPRLMEIVGKYEQGRSQVEPLAFYTKLHRVRKRMFRFLGSVHGPRN